MSRQRSLPYLAFVAAALSAVVLSVSARAATTENFMIRSTADFVALCETQPSEANYVAAIHFCQGFASGAYQYYSALAQANPSARYVCVSDPPPSRDQAIAGFLAWARSNPDALAQPAVESIFRYLGQAYPCSAAQRAPAN